MEIFGQAFGISLDNFIALNKIGADRHWVGNSIPTLHIHRKLLWTEHISFLENERKKKKNYKYEWVQFWWFVKYRWDEKKSKKKKIIIIMSRLSTVVSGALDQCCVGSNVRCVIQQILRNKNEIPENKYDVQM